MAAVVRHLDAVAAATAPFTLVLRGTASFRPVSPVVFVVVDVGVAECAALEARVRSGDMGVEARYPYHPHVTVAHDVGDDVLDRAMAELADVDVEMSITTMGLWEHRAGHWDIVQSFEFRG